MNDGEDRLRDLPLLASLPREDLQALGKRGRARKYAAGEVIFRQGEPGESLHIVLEGVIRVAALSPAGDEATVALLRPGDACGELAVLDGYPRSANAIAVEATSTLVITREDFLQWLVERPTAALGVLETVSLRLRRTDEAMADLIFADVAHRLARLLLDLAAREAKAGRVHSDEGVVRITQEQLASMLGTTRQSVNKQLNSWAGEGWVGLGRGAVHLKDLPALRAFV